MSKCSLDPVKNPICAVESQAKNMSKAGFSNLYDKPFMPGTAMLMTTKFWSSDNLGASSADMFEFLKFCTYIAEINLVRQKLESKFIKFSAFMKSKAQFQESTIYFALKVSQEPDSMFRRISVK